MAPFSDEKLPSHGISLDVTRAVLNRAGCDVQIAILPWNRVVTGARNGDYDIITSLFHDPEMETFLNYSEPFFEAHVKFVRAIRSDTVFDGLSSLAPHSIAVGKGLLYNPAFDAADDLNKFEVTTTLQAVQMVAAGRV
ncbi:transporter substrate-binding domain-containing protein [Roseobacter sp.]|uniref:substrate-binding periplasmic protein n=1 Tax=Roseobacter sp. TaxID=1907202 RepID=UPI0032994F4C